MWEVVTELGKILGGAGILVAALTYLAKKLLTQWMDKDVEKHKATLQAQNAIGVEKLRSDLRQQSLEHEVKYRRNDEKVADHLHGTYKRLLCFYECICSYVKIIESDEAPKNEKLDETQKASKEFWDYFLPNRLYIPPTLFRKTKAFAEKLTSITNDFTKNLKRERDGRDVEDIHFWSKAFSEINEEQGSVFSSLVEEFQKRLGVFDLDED